MKDNGNNMEHKIEELESRLEFGGWLGGGDDTQDCQGCSCDGDGSIEIKIDDTPDPNKSS